MDIFKVALETYTVGYTLCGIDKRVYTESVYGHPAPLPVQVTLLHLPLSLFRSPAPLPVQVTLLHLPLSPCSGHPATPAPLPVQVTSTTLRDISSAVQRPSPSPCLLLPLPLPALLHPPPSPNPTKISLRWAKRSRRTGGRCWGTYTRE